MKKQIKSTNSMVVKFMHQEFDNVFSQVNAICQDVMVGRQFQKLSRITNSWEFDVLYLYDTSQTLSHLNKNPAVTDFVLFSPSLDFFISTTRWGSLEDFYMINEFNLDWQKDRMAGVFGAQRRTMVLEDVSSVLPGGETMNRILVIRPISYVKNGWSHDFLMAFLVDISPLYTNSLNDFQDMVLLNRLTGDIYYNHTGNFTINGNRDFLREIPSGESQFHQGRMVSAIASDHSNLLYAVVMEFGSYFHTLIILFMLSIVYCILALGGGWTIVRWRLQMDWQLYDQAMKKVGSSVDDITNFDSLYSPFVSSVSELKKEKEAMGSIIKEQTLSLRSHIIEKILDSGREPISRVSLEECGIHLISNSFVALLVADSSTEDQDREEAIIRWFEKQGITVLPFSSHHGIALILNLPDGRKETDLLAYFIKEMNRFHENFPSLKGNVSSSDIITDLDSLGEAYLQAVNVMEYKKSINNSEFIMYRDVIEMSSQINYSYTTEQELLLSHAIQCGDSVGAEQIFRSLIEENQSLGVSPQRLRYLVFSFVDTLIRCANHLDKRFKSSIPSITLPTILQADDFDISCNEVIQIVKKICQAVQGDEIHLEIQGGAHFEIYKKIIDEIDNHYRNPMINVSFLADDLGISVVLLSRIFKKYHSMNILEYLSSVRIEAAKKLLGKGFLVSDVVGECGFGSLRTFMRIFKKSENMTPGKYKELQFKELGCKTIV